MGCFTLCIILEPKAKKMKTDQNPSMDKDAEADNDSVNNSEVDDVTNTSSCEDTKCKSCYVPCYYQKNRNSYMLRNNLEQSVVIK